MQAKIEEAFAHLGAILMQTAASDDKIIIGHVRDAHGLLQDVLRAPSPRAPSEDDDWKDDPSADERWQAGLDFGLLELCAVADERWQAGLDFGLLELCAVLDVKPHDVTWDAATETLDGDVSAVIGNILRAKYGEDFDPTSPAPTAAPTLGREADCDCGAATSGKWSGIHSEGCSAMRETTGIDDVEWLDAKVVELAKENERLRAALTAPDKGGPDHRAALIRISDLDWAWEGGGSKVRHRGPCGKIAAKALGIPDELPLGWPDHKSSETEAALARSVAENEQRALLEKRFADRKSSSSVHDHTFSEGASPAPSTGEREAWQPIETAPRDGTAIFAYWTPTPQFVGDIGELVDVVSFTDGQWWGGDEFEVDYARSPTHWKPVGAPPAMNGEDEGG